MTDATIFLIDNSLFAQNQDYFPNRYLAQQETIKYFINSSSDYNKFGIIPIGQITPNNIITPTDNRLSITDYLTKLRICEKKCNISKSIKISNDILMNIQKANNKMVIFLSVILDDIELEKIIESIAECNQSNYEIFIFLFGDANDSFIYFEHELSSMDIKIFQVKNDQNFKSFVCEKLIENRNEEIDPQLARALEISAKEYEESNKNK